eukprot:TRINITY_DN19126_c0_g1_i1.p1 TRINITY_DN19126_c0_g1~~TRINITY_DN19126_c0_g1_i1.p1  ORF type:complete len:101 (+),score=27.46 TRINITY_DN19126_c0_g1_i1:44-304(+)
MEKEGEGEVDEVAKEEEGEANLDEELEEDGAEFLPLLSLALSIQEICDSQTTLWGVLCIATESPRPQWHAIIFSLLQKTDERKIVW